MGPHDDLIAKRRDAHAAGDHPVDGVMDPVNLRPDSFCATMSVMVDSPAGSGSVVVFTDSPADFVAWLRWSNLPWELWHNGPSFRGTPEEYEAYERGFPDHSEGAEAYLGRFEADTDTMLRECLALMDEVLGQDEITSDDVGRVITTYNELFLGGDFGAFELTFEAHGSLVDCLRHYSEWFGTLEDEELEDPDASEWDLLKHKIGTLLESGTLDPNIPEHLHMAREAMASLEDSLM